MLFAAIALRYAFPIDVYTNTGFTRQLPTLVYNYLDSSEKKKIAS